MTTEAENDRLRSELARLDEALIASVALERKYRDACVALRGRAESAEKLVAPAQNYNGVPDAKKSEEWNAGYRQRQREEWSRAINAEANFVVSQDEVAALKAENDKLRQTDDDRMDEMDTLCEERDAACEASEDYMVNAKRAREERDALKAENEKLRAIDKHGVYLACKCGTHKLCLTVGKYSPCLECENAKLRADLHAACYECGSDDPESQNLCPLEVAQADLAEAVMLLHDLAVEHGGYVEAVVEFLAKHTKGGE